MDSGEKQESNEEFRKKRFCFVVKKGIYIRDEEDSMFFIIGNVLLSKIDDFEFSKITNDE